MSVQAELARLEAGRAMVAESWSQGAYQRDNGSRCLEGALAVPNGRGALVKDPVMTSVVRRLAAEITARGEGELMDTYNDRMLAVTQHSVWQWNDHPDRTQAQVLELMDTVITRLQALVAEHSWDRHAMVAALPSIPLNEYPVLEAAVVTMAHVHMVGFSPVICPEDEKVLVVT